MMLIQLCLIFILVGIIVSILSADLVLSWGRWLKIIRYYFLSLILITFLLFLSTLGFLLLIERVNVFKSLLNLFLLLYFILFLLNLFFGFLKCLLVICIFHCINLLLEFCSLFILLIFNLLFVSFKLLNLLFHFQKLLIVFFLLLFELLILLFIILLFLELNSNLLLLNELFLNLVHLDLNKLLLFFLRESELFKLSSKLLVDNFLSFLHDFLFIELILVFWPFLLNFLSQGISEFFALINLSLKDGFVYFHELDVLRHVSVILNQKIQLNLSLVLNLKVRHQFAV